MKLRRTIDGPVLERDGAHLSRDARMEESEASGSADVYDRVYDAVRPELFFKATPHRVVGPGEPVRIRADSRWNIPEPELTLAISAAGRLFGYTIGNDMSSRDIEGENPLYLPQAKIYDGCASLGPELLVTDEPLSGETRIALMISRHGIPVFEGETEVAQIKRSFDELVDYLTREATFPCGCYLMTGAGVVPPPDFTLVAGDLISITIDGIGTLTNVVG
jgi:2-dehydro-3-deoxy-D-arabinonate dehydratase